MLLLELYYQYDLLIRTSHIKDLTDMNREVQHQPEHVDSLLRALGCQDTVHCLNRVRVKVQIWFHMAQVEQDNFPGL